jgi:hypothetical protein
LAATLLTTVALFATPVAAATSCAGLASLSIPNGTIMSATLVPASASRTVMVVPDSFDIVFARIAAGLDFDQFEIALA